MSSGVLERRGESSGVWSVRSEGMQPDNVTTGIRLHKNFSVVLEREVLEQLHCITAASLIKCDVL